MSGSGAPAPDIAGVAGLRVAVVAASWHETVMDGLVDGAVRTLDGLEGYGLAITDRVALEIAPNRHNIDYLRTKRDRMGHDLPHHLDPTEGTSS